MDFFEHQVVARKKTARLVALFAIGVLGTAVVLYLVLAFGMASQSTRPGGAPLFDPLLFAGVVGGVLVFVGAIAAFRGATVAKDGKSVAEFLGGRLLLRNSNDPDEKRLLNVVEEMSLASGMPVPPVYVVEEPTINAFAAGRTSSDAVLGFTRGALLALDRDEVQGVVGHEFSHIKNGDSALNLRLMAWIFGIAALGQVGEFILRTGIGSRSSRNKDSAGPVFFLGLALLVVGSIGYGVGRMIQAAVSRQREFLADASSVQFTRNPDGIGGALAKIDAMGSSLASPRAGEVRHLMFGAAGRGFSALTATHPPIAQRLQRIGRTSLLGKVKPSARAEQALERSNQNAADRATVAAGWIASLGEARRRLDQMPSEIRAEAGDPLGAAAMVLALLLSHGDATAELQLRTLADWPELAHEVTRLRAVARRVPPLERLPAVDLCLPALALMTPVQFERFFGAVEAFVAADGRLEPFEWALVEVVRARVFPRFGRAVRPAGTTSLKEAAGEVRAILAWVASAAGTNDAVRAAYAAGVRTLRAAGVKLVSEQDLMGSGAAAMRLAQRGDLLRGLAESDRRLLLAACESAAEQDRRLRPQEAELLRALAEALALEPRLAPPEQPPSR